MHLFDAEARKEEALCGAETSADDRTSLKYYARSNADTALPLAPSASVQGSVGRVRQASLPGIRGRRTDGRGPRIPMAGRHTGEGDCL